MHNSEKISRALSVCADRMRKRAELDYRNGLLLDLIGRRIVKSAFWPGNPRELITGGPASHTSSEGTSAPDAPAQSSNGGSERTVEAPAPAGTATSSSETPKSEAPASGGGGKPPESPKSGGRHGHHRSGKGNGQSGGDRKPFITREGVKRHPTLVGTGVGATAALIYEALREKERKEDVKGYLSRAIIGALAGGAISTAFPNQTRTAVDNVSNAVRRAGGKRT